MKKSSLLLVLCGILFCVVSFVWYQQSESAQAWYIWWSLQDLWYGASTQFEQQCISYLNSSTNSRTRYQKMVEPVLQKEIDIMVNTKWLFFSYNKKRAQRRNDTLLEEAYRKSPFAKKEKDWIRSCMCDSLIDAKLYFSFCSLGNKYYHDDSDIQLIQAFWVKNRALSYKDLFLWKNSASIIRSVHGSATDSDQINDMTTQDDTVDDELSDIAKELIGESWNKKSDTSTNPDEETAWYEDWSQDYASQDEDTSEDTTDSYTDSYKDLWESQEDTTDSYSDLSYQEDQTQDTSSQLQKKVSDPSYTTSPSLAYSSIVWQSSSPLRLTSIVPSSSTTSTTSSTR